MKGIFFSVILVSFVWVQAFGQTSKKDSMSKVYDTYLCDSAEEVAQKVLEAIRTRRFENVKTYIPSLEFMTHLVDSVDSTNIVNTARIRNNYHINKVRKEFIVMMKDAKRNNINLRDIKIIKTVLKPGTTNYGVTTTAVYFVFKKGDKQFMISFLVIEMLDYWFMGDELRLELLI